MKKIISILLAVLFILSSCFTIVYASASDNSINYNYLKNFLIKNGTKNSESYSITNSKVEGDYKYFWGIYYNYTDKEIFFSCSQTKLDMTVEINEFLYVSNRYDKGYEIGLIASQTKYNYLVFGQGIVYPEKFNKGDSIAFKKSDSTNKPVTDTALDNLASSFFNLALLLWEEMLEDNLNITLGNFGFKKLYSEKSIEGVVNTKAKISIKNNPKTTTQNYGTILVLSVETTDVPDDCSYVWYFNDEKTEVYNEPGYVNCGFQNCKVTVKLIDANGAILVDENGKEISDSETINVKSNIFIIIIAFIRQLLFGQNVVYQ